MVVEREVVSSLNNYVGREAFERCISTGGGSFRCFVSGGYKYGDLLYDVGTFEQDGLFFDIISVGMTASESIIRYFDVRVDGFSETLA